MFLRVENYTLAALECAAEAAFLPKNQKLTVLLDLRRNIEITKRLVRVAGELQIIKPAKYIELSADLQEISKMTNGWIKSCS